MKNTLTIIIVSMLVLLFVSCADKQTDFRKKTGYDIKCIDGVEYLMGFRSFAPHFKPDGSLFTCDEG